MNNSNYFNDGIAFSVITQTFKVLQDKETKKWKSKEYNFESTKFSHALRELVSFHSKKDLGCLIKF